MRRDANAPFARTARIDGGDAKGVDRRACVRVVKFVSHVRGERGDFKPVLRVREGSAQIEKIISVFSRNAGIHGVLKIAAIMDKIAPKRHGP